ncbi:CCDC50 family protein [Megaselia abdita]
MTEYTTEGGTTLPKTGHVNEVCKEWLVREDGALAYKLQSEEITDFYKGNRQRNAVVRHDFPTALEEQIKEREFASRQAEQYRRYLSEQEEHDKEIAKEIADKLERDIEEQRLRDLEESESVAQAMHEMYVNLPPPQRRPQRIEPIPIEQASYSKPQKSSSSRHQHSNGHDRIVMAPAPAPNYENIQRRHINHSAQSSTSSAALDAIEPFNPPTPKSRSNTNSLDKPLPEYENIKSPIQKLSPEKFDILMGNHGSKKKDSSNEILNFEELGLPIEEIKEINSKMAQERKDEAFARQLQELEKGGVSVSQEEKDRMMAIEAQDKELAKMLQDREKAKARRAKEKARLKKQQMQKSLNESQISQDESPVLEEKMNESIHDVDLEPYSNPIDLIPHNFQYRQQHQNDKPKNLQHLAYGKDDDLYTLPFDTRNGGHHPGSQVAPAQTQINRPNSMHVSPETTIHLPRTEAYIGPRDIKLTEISSRLPHSLSSSFGKISI